MFYIYPTFGSYNLHSTGIGMTGTKGGAGQTGTELSKTMTHQRMQETVTEAQNRKNMLSNFCHNNGYTSFDGLNKILEVFYEQGISEYLTFSGFARFVRVDESKENRAVFRALVGDRKKIESKVLILCLLNCIAN